MAQPLTFVAQGFRLHVRLPAALGMDGVRNHPAGGGADSSAVPYLGKLCHRLLHRLPLGELSLRAALLRLA